MFRVDDVLKLGEFETCHLEWLAVFLSIPDWRPKTTVSESTDEEEVRRRRTPLNTTRIAVDSLRSQLGVAEENSKSGIFFSDFLTRFPLFQRTLHRCVWRMWFVPRAGL